MLNFKKIDVNANDIQQQWIATNALIEDVIIVHNDLDEYETWVEGEYAGSFHNFQNAKQMAENLVNTALNWKI